MNKALIVIDVQKFFLNRETKPVVDKIRNFLNRHSTDYSQIYFTIFKNNSRSPLWQIAGWQGCRQTPETDICDEIKKFTGKTNLFYKNILSAAKIPAIKRNLKTGGINGVHLCGFDTDCCILATAYDLFDQNIKPLLLENLTWSTAKEKLHGAAIKMIKRNIGFTQKA